MICGATRSLQEQIASGQVEISELRGKMTVKLKDKVLFAPASAGLNKEGKTALDEVASAFRDLKGKNVVVAGYTDDVPLGSNSGFPDNWALSTARAVDVVRYLQSKGVSLAMLGAAGFSEYRPVVPQQLGSEPQPEPAHRDRADGSGGAGGRGDSEEVEAPRGWIRAHDEEKSHRVPESSPDPDQRGPASAAGAAVGSGAFAVSPPAVAAAAAAGAAGFALTVSILHPSLSSS